MFRSVSINSVSAPRLFHKKCAANQGDAGEQKVDPYNKVWSVAALDLLLSQAPNHRAELPGRDHGHSDAEVRSKVGSINPAPRTTRNQCCAHGAHRAHACARASPVHAGADGFAIRQESAYADGSIAHHRGSVHARLPGAWPELVKGCRTEAMSCATFSECESEAAGMDALMTIESSERYRTAQQGVWD